VWRQASSLCDNLEAFLFFSYLDPSLSGFGRSWVLGGTQPAAIVKHLMFLIYTSGLTLEKASN
jgi:hypothetical protein